jgi:hypothetical protein
VACNISPYCIGGSDRLQFPSFRDLSRIASLAHECWTSQEVRMRKTPINFALLASSLVAALVVGASHTTPVVAGDTNRKIAIRDDCQPNADWGPGGCLLREGDVTRAEFFLEAESPLAPTSVIGHQGWWNDPPYLNIASGETVRVKN